MCGICGVVGKAVDPSLLAAMTEVVRHRGPDDGGTYVAPNGAAGLGNRRLAIIDLSPAGRMPMSNRSGTLWITYNGEVYNYRELRAELQAQGCVFRSATDTEVVLQMYERYGTDAFERLNGMFAFALWDKRSEELLLVRDRLGVKPLYHTSAQGPLLFASEIKSILQDPAVERAIEPEALHYYLAHLWVPGPLTMLRGIHKLTPGHFLRWQAGRYEIKPYWRLAWPTSEAPERSDEDWAAELRHVLEGATERHLIADVPVGLLLSGGLDSTTLLALMSRLTREPVDAYTITFRARDARLEQSAGDDDRYAKLAARRFGAHLHRIELAPDVVSLLPRVVWHLDEPIADPAAINTLLLAEAARSRVKVLLSGQGADELFGGYRVHLVDRFSRLLSRVPAPLRQRVLAPVLGCVPSALRTVPGLHPGVLLAFSRYFLKVLAGVDLPRVERYVAARSHLTQDEILQLYGPERRVEGAGYDGGRAHRALLAEVGDEDFVNQMSHVDLRTFLPELNLAYGDKMTMAASVEMRVPFLDYEVIDLATRIPPRLKIRALTGKYVLRRAMAPLLPGGILHRRKAGFGAPIRRWLAHDLADVTAEYLAADQVRRRGLLDPLAVQRILDEHRQGTADWTYPVWALLTLEAWHRTFLDTDRVRGVAARPAQGAASPG